MSCLLSRGFNQRGACRAGIGGIRTVYIAGFDDIGTIGKDASGNVSGFSASGTIFFEYDVTPETANFVETITANEQNGSIFYEQVFTLVMNNMSQTKRNEIRVLGQKRLAIVTLAENGQYNLLGETTGMIMNGGTTGTGTAKGDRNGYSLTFMAREADPAPHVLAAALTSKVSAVQATE